MRAAIHWLSITALSLLSATATAYALLINKVDFHSQSDVRVLRIEMILQIPSLVLKSIMFATRVNSKG